MKRIQGTFLTGYVTVVVTGEQPEHFFQLCMDQLQVAVWDIQKQSATVCTGKMRLRDIKNIRQVRRGLSYKISFTDKKGYPFIWRSWLKKKHIVVSVFLSFLLILALSNIIWSIQVTGVSSEIEEKIVQALDKKNVQKGNWMFSVSSPSHIQYAIMQEVPELLWVGVEKKGTTFILEGIEKKRVDPIEEASPRHLVASKPGTITFMHVSTGEPVVRVHDAVEKGDVLVSGMIEQTGDEDGEITRVVAEGEVIAETWYEVEVSIPLDRKIERVTGEQTNHWYIHIGSFPIRIWGWRDLTYETTFIEEDEQPIYFLQWKTPFTLRKKINHEQITTSESHTKDEAILIAIEQVHQDLRLQLGPDVLIKDEKVLHETVENGKVNVQLLITVEEDIVEIEPLPQGD